MGLIDIVIGNATKTEVKAVQVNPYPPPPGSTAITVTMYYLVVTIQDGSTYRVGLNKD